MINDPEQQSIRASLRDSRKEWLINYLKEFITLLEEEGYSLQEFLEALADCLYRQQSLPDDVIRHLEDAALELHRLTTNQSKN
ncbi:MAG: hypothetical protein V7L22_23575 [Nostoc sp.]|uniref:hypothetical protein n=1 Tax=Nostoc sp. TaxID=1180 RepID=UPI002FF83342